MFRVGSADNGAWRRLTVVPFQVVIPERDGVQNYAEVLARDAEKAILSWAIEGAGNFIRNGCKLDIPDAVEEFRWSQVGSENQSFTKQVGVCFEKVTVPAPTRHHLIGNAALDEWKSLWKREIMLFFWEPMPYSEEALSKYGESDSA